MCVCGVCLVCVCVSGVCMCVWCVSVWCVSVCVCGCVMFKVKNGLCPEIMRDLFQLRENPDGKTRFVIPRVNNE